MKDGKTGFMALFNEESGLGGLDIYKLEILSGNVPVIIEKQKFEKSFVLDLTNPEDEEKISISYDKKTNQIKVMSSKQRNYIINITEVK